MRKIVVEYEGIFKGGCKNTFLKKDTIHLCRLKIWTRKNYVLTFLYIQLILNSFAMIIYSKI